MTLTPTLAALFGSIATAIAIFGGGLAVEAYKWRRDRIGMALALAGAIDAVLGLIETRDMTKELEGALVELDAGHPVEFASLIRDNGPYEAITLSYTNRLGALGGDLPFRIARFLTYMQGLQHDLARIQHETSKPRLQATLIRRMSPLWDKTQELGDGLVADLRRAAGVRPRVRRSI